MIGGLQNVSQVIHGLDAHDKLILYGAKSLGKDLKSEVKMQKLMFLTTNAISDKARDEMDFIPHKKGPYSPLIEQKMEELSDKGLISLPDCHISNDGRLISDNAEPKKPLRDIVDSFKEFICILNEDELLQFIYVTFPNYTSDSEEWERISKKRAENAASMLKKGSVSFSKAVELSGMNQSDFSNYLKEKGVRWRVV